MFLYFKRNFSNIAPSRTDKKKTKFSSYIKEIQMGYEEGFPNIRGNAQIYGEAVSHIWLWTRSLLNFLIYEENYIFFFISAYSVVPQFPKTFKSFIKLICSSLVALFLALTGSERVSVSWQCDGANISLIIYWVTDHWLTAPPPSPFLVTALACSEKITHQTK